MERHVTGIQRPDVDDVVLRPNSVKLSELGVQRRDRGLALGQARVQRLHGEAGHAKTLLHESFGDGGAGVIALRDKLDQAGVQALTQAPYRLSLCRGRHNNDARERGLLPGGAGRRENVP